MDKKQERNRARMIIKCVAKALKPHGFIHSKTTFVCKPHDYIISFFHFHKFSFGPKFRIHTGIRVLNDTFEAASLNGIGEEHAGAFAEDEQSINNCIQKMTKFCLTEGLEWLNKFSDTTALLEDPSSPLKEFEKNRLRNHLNGILDEKTIQESYKLLGIEKSHTS